MLLRHFSSLYSHSYLVPLQLLQVSLLEFYLELEMLVVSFYTFFLIPPQGKYNNKQADRPKSV
jgi:hypothetical protein